MIEHVTPAPDAVHAASATVFGYLASDLESSSSSAAHAAATSNDDINEKLTSIINMFDSYWDMFAVRVWFFFIYCCPCSTRTSSFETPQTYTVRPFAWGIAGHGLPGSSGHLYDTPDFERVMVWTVYEMASFGRGLGIPLPFLGCQPDTLIGAYCGDASRTRVESAFFFQAETSSLLRRVSPCPSYFSGLFSLVIKSAVPTKHHRTWSSFTVPAEREATRNVKEKRCASYSMNRHPSLLFERPMRNLTERGYSPFFVLFYSYGIRMFLCTNVVLVSVFLRS